MKLLLTTDQGDTLQEFTLPKDKDVTEDEARMMGQTVAASINRIGPRLEAYNKVVLETCTCFWKEKTPEEREVFTGHSSACAIWDLKPLDLTKDEEVNEVEKDKNSE